MNVEFHPFAPLAMSIRESVFAFIRRNGSYGATDEEVQTALAINPSTQRPRRIELVKAGRVYDSGARRKTLANLDAVVWVAATL